MKKLERSFNAVQRTIEVDGVNRVVEDAPLDAVISITRADLRSGRPGIPRRCPIAVSRMRELGTGVAIIWGTRGIIEAPNGRLYRYFFPVATRRWIEAVDAGLPVEPCELKLLAPSGSNRLGLGNRGGPAGLMKKAGKADQTRTPREWKGPRGNYSLRSAVTL